jgi:putative DNA primase/helicase
MRKWCYRSETRSKLDAIVHLARGEPPVSDDGERWDLNPTLICPGNGVVELDTGTFRPGRREDYITMRTRVPYDPHAQCPRWIAFLNEVLSGDPHLIAHVHRALGYAITGYATKQCFFLLFGKSSNGKSCLLHTVRFVLGDYAHAAPFSLFEWRQRGPHPQALAQLEGKRLVTASEAAEGCRLNETRLKAIAGGDPITVHLMYHNDRMFTCVSTVFIGSSRRTAIALRQQGQEPTRFLGPNVHGWHGFMRVKSSFNHHACRSFQNRANRASPYSLARQMRKKAWTGHK